MEAYLTYALKSALLLSIFWGVYAAFLKRETFFNINRGFLILGILTALLLPLVEFQRIVYSQMQDTSLIAVQPTSLDVKLTAQTNWWLFLFFIYSIGASCFGIQFAIELLSVNRIIRGGKRSKKIGKVSYIEVDQPTSPFSFFNTIVYNPDVLHGQDLDTVLMHEHVHISQKHSVDMILASVTKIILWFNPISWWYKKELTQNLEYIADFESCAQPSTSEKEYQYLLLQQLSGISNSIINPFFNSLIKKRILMLQKQRSHKKSSWKYALVLPFLVGFMILFSFKTHVSYLPSSSASIDFSTNKKDSNLERVVPQDTLTPLYVVDGKQQSANFEVSSIPVDSIKSITILKDKSAEAQYGSKGKNGAILIELKSKDGFITIRSKEPRVLSASSSTKNPLIYVDGKKMDDNFNFNTIDPNEIKSMEVLKDQNAINTYGKDAKDGVIKITTKTQKK